MTDQQVRSIFLFTSGNIYLIQMQYILHLCTHYFKNYPKIAAIRFVY